jgi:eukaryotic-like serine/threonine-protein kinase
VTAEAPELDYPDMTGELVAGKYRVESLLGTGGMGTVWLGHHEALGTKVAIKFIKPQFSVAPDARRRFEIEARAAAKLQSKHAVKVYDYGVTEGGTPYIVMECLEGESLSDALIRRGPMPASEVGKVFGQAGRALAKAHKMGIVHRDIKPDNIFLATNSEDPDPELPYTVKLVDFGIAKVLDAPKDGSNPMGGPTQEGAVIGTPNFMSPEQLTIGGAPGPLTDLWSLGACAFAAFTARIPFEGEVLGDIVLKVCAAPMPTPSSYNANVPPGLDAWFARACNRDVSKRFQTAEEFAQSLNAVCGNERVKTATLNEDQVQYALRTPDAESLRQLEDLEVPEQMSPRTALMAGFVLAVALMVGFLGFLAWRDKQKVDDFQKHLPPIPSASVTHSAPAPSPTPTPSTAISSSASSVSPTPSASH